MPQPNRTGPKRPVRYYINVASAVCRSNKKTGACAPAIVVRRGRSGRSNRATRVFICDAAGNVVAAVSQLERPLSCGATVYVECLYAPRASAAQSTRV
jgi:hypothetical protein